MWEDGAGGGSAEAWASVPAELPKGKGWSGKGGEEKWGTRRYEICWAAGSPGGGRGRRSDLCFRRKSVWCQGRKLLVRVVQEPLLGYRPGVMAAEVDSGKVKGEGRPKNVLGVRIDRSW